MEIAPGIHRLEAPLGERFVALYLLCGDTHAALVDNGLDSTPREVLTPYLRSIGLPLNALRYVLTSHADYDHLGGNATLRELAPGALFVCHTLDRPGIEDVAHLITHTYGQFAVGHGIGNDHAAMEAIRSQARGTAVDLTLVGEEQLRLGDSWWVEVLHTPGHTPGHLSVYDRRSGTAIVADAMLECALYTAAGAAAFPPTYRYVDAYLNTIRRLQQLPITTLLTGHYPVLRGEQVATFLASSVHFVQRVETALRDTLRRVPAPRSLGELAAELSPQLGAWPEGAAPMLAYPLLGHLERLLQAGLVEQSRSNGMLAYTWRA